MVKKFIPGGSTAGAGKVPGSPEEMELEELMDVNWGDIQEKAKGLGSKLLTDMEKDFKDQDEKMAARKKIWRQALAMCQKDKSAYQKELQDTQKSIQMLATPVKFTEDLPDFKLGDALNKYSADIKAATMGTVSDAEIAHNKSNLAKLTTAVEAGL
jgi:hypothetical protein